MQRVQAQLRESYPGVVVELAFLEFMAPDLPTRVAELATAGVQQISIIPMFIAQGGHLKNELPAMLNSLRSTYPDIQFSLSGPIGELDEVILAMARGAARIAGLPLA